MPRFQFLDPKKDPKTGAIIPLEILNEQTGKMDKVTSRVMTYQKSRNKEQQEADRKAMLQNDERGYTEVVGMKV